MSARGCTAELCARWTGDGCICAVMGVDSACGPCSVDMHHNCDAADSEGLVSCCCDPAAAAVTETREGER